jgi:hypothetical protein
MQKCIAANVIHCFKQQNNECVVCGVSGYMLSETVFAPLSLSLF